jgi:enhancer of polycomb-like protein
MSSNPDADPYVCFRQREIKTFRKVRRSDTVALDKLRRLKEDMANCKHLLDLVYEREKTKKESIEMEHLVFEKRVYMRRLRKHLGITTVDPLDNSPDPRHRKRSRRFGDEESSTKIRIPIASLRDAANLVSDMDSHMFDESKFLSTDQRIEEKIKREKALNERSGWIDTTEVFDFDIDSLHTTPAFEILDSLFGY